MSLSSHLVLPSEVSAFEASYLGRLKRVAIVFFAAHIPLLALVAWVNDTDPSLALKLGALILCGPLLALGLENPRLGTIVNGVAAMGFGGLLVHFGQGPAQIEMHFYFFALIAMLAVYGNPLVIVAAALTVALHHLVLWWYLPSSVFNYDAPLWVVLIHAAFVVLESIASCFIARSFFDNVIGLERLVRARTRDLDQCMHDMRLVLDNVAQGFLTIDRAGIPSVERSAIVVRWFGVPAPGHTLFDVFSCIDAEFGRLSRVAWEQVVESVLPLDLALDQMPRMLRVGDTHYSIEYRTIGSGVAPARFLVVITDISGEMLRARTEVERQEVMQLFERMLADRSGFEAFFDEATSISKSLFTGPRHDLQVLQRQLHTLKGNAALYGLGSIADACHDLESAIVETGEASSLAFTVLEERWRRVATQVNRLLGSQRQVLELSEAQYKALERAAVFELDRMRLIQQVHELRLEPTERRLAHYREQAMRIGARLGKHFVVEIEHHGLSLDPRYWSGFWSAFIHAVRNAVDHGIESESVRDEAGKPALGRIRFSTRRVGDCLVVEVSDDGRGIQWSRVSESARKLGLPADTSDELREALLAGGVSTAERVTDVSGRGVGLSALKREIDLLSGRLEIESEAGRGTTMRMVFDAARMAPELPALLAQRSPSLPPAQRGAGAARSEEAART
jgi:two-component system chemotaxis sensor kinase CheA